MADDDKLLKELAEAQKAKEDAKAVEKAGKDAWDKAKGK